MYKLPLYLPFTRTVTETDLILGVLACVEVSRNIGPLGPFLLTQSQIYNDIRRN